MIAIPIIYSVYVGIAEAARDLILQQVVSKGGDDDHICYLVGGLENELTATRLALQQMISTTVSTTAPSLQTTNQIMTGRTLVAQGVLKVMDLAMDISGGRAFARSFGLEKLFRDAQGVRYHPIREKEQRLLAGKLAMGVKAESI